MFRYLLFLVVVILVGCRPQTVAQQSEPLPTLFPTATKAINLEDSERVANLFLDAWSNSDFDAMHNLISFSSQEAVPLETFRQIYEDAHNAMTFESLTYSGNTLLRQNPRLVIFNYDVTIQTRIMGEFSDLNRDLQLMIDPQYGEWRVAWSAAAIFAEMGNGAQLVFETGVPSRANIYDRNGEVLADQNGVIVNVIVVKEDVVDMATCIASLVQVLDKPLDVIQDQLDRAGVNWEVEVGTIEPITYSERGPQLERDCNATFSRRATRRYLRGSLMPHILGNVGFPDESEIPALEEQGFNQDTIIGKKRR